MTMNVRTRFYIVLEPATQDNCGHQHRTFEQAQNCATNQRRGSNRKVTIVRVDLSKPDEMGDRKPDYTVVV